MIAGWIRVQALGDYFETYVERDVSRQLGNIRESLEVSARFVRLCAGRDGTVAQRTPRLSSDASREYQRLVATVLEARSFRLATTPTPKSKVSETRRRIGESTFSVSKTDQIATHPLRAICLKTRLLLRSQVRPGAPAQPIVFP